MPARFEVKLVRIGNSLRMTIPKPIADGLGLKAGDVMVISALNEQIVIRKRGK